MTGRAALYRMVWRWHFYAALYVLPLVVVLSLSGALFLFKPQVERWRSAPIMACPWRARWPLRRRSRPRWPA
jgi:uncharacterized iron-regulated membrane protein